MSIFRLQPALVAGFFAGTLLLGGERAAAETAAETVVLQTAAAEGRVEYSFFGTGSTSSLDLVMKNRSQKPLIVVLPTGSPVVPSNPDTQTYALGSNGAIPIPLTGETRGTLKAYCTARERAPTPLAEDAGRLVAPSARDLSIAEIIVVADRIAAKRSQAAAGTQPADGEEPIREAGEFEQRAPEQFREAVYLHAIWALTDGAGKAEAEERLLDDLSKANPEADDGQIKQTAERYASEVMFGAEEVLEERARMAQEGLDFSSLDPTLKPLRELSQEDESS